VVDGIHFPFESVPAYDTISWNTRKCVYAMGCTAVCDHQGRFLYVSTGYVGSLNDSLAFKGLRLYRYSSNFFAKDEYLLGDAGYSLTETVVTCFKGNDVPRDERRFNGAHGSARVKIEHSFGWLKLKWQSLQYLPVKINSRRDISKASKWIVTCMVLHNICLLHPGRGETDDAEANWIMANPHARLLPLQQHEDDLMMEGDVGGLGNNEREMGKKRRDKLKRYVLKHRYRNENI
jgi:hypothetical protein